MPHEPARDREQVVTLLFDPEDDKAMQDALRDRCGNGSGRLLISPAPRACAPDALAGHVFAALGVWDRRGYPPRNKQLLLDGIESEPLKQPEQLELLSVPSQREMWAELNERSRPTRRLRNLYDAIDPVRDAGIRDLYVLRAHAMHHTGWSVLGKFARDCGAHLNLVVHAQSARPEQIAALGKCRIVFQSTDRQHSIPSWSAKPVFRRAAGTNPVASERDAHCTAA